MKVFWMCVLCVVMFSFARCSPAPIETKENKEEKLLAEKAPEKRAEPVVDAGAPDKPVEKPAIPEPQGPPPPIANGVKARIVHVTDGDTVYLITRTGAWAESIRLLGFNAPECEKKKSGSFAICSADTEFYGVSAYDRLHELSNKYRGKEFLVTCKNDGKTCEKDAFDRYLLYLTTPDGKDVGKLLLAAGAGWSFTRYNSEKRGEYCRAEAEAIRKKLGMWAQGRAFVKGKMGKSTLSWYYDTHSGQSHDSLCTKALGESFTSLAGE